MTDHNRTEADRLQYIQPEGSLEEQPPARDARIKRWMVVGGERLARHASLKEAWRAERQKILKASIFMLLWVAGIITSAFALIGGLVLASSLLTAEGYLISPYSALIAALVVCASLVAAVFILALWPRRGSDPLEFVRRRYDLAYDEFALSFAVVIAVLLPVGFIVHFTVG